MWIFIYLRNENQKSISSSTNIKRILLIKNVLENDKKPLTSTKH